MLGLRACARRSVRQRFSSMPPTSASQTSGQFPHMMAPLALKNGVTLKNRVIMGSMHTGLEEGHGGKLDAMAAFYEARAAGGAGLIVTGGIAPNRAGWVSPFAAKLTSKSEAAAHKVVTDAVHQHPGAKIAMQILHSGRYGYHPLNVAPSSIKAPIGLFTPKELSHQEILDTIAAYAKSASLAAEAGYDGVEIMGSEGYLINQFIASRTNKRTDSWGGAYENRIKLAAEIVKATRAAVNDDFVVIFRLSMLDLVDGGSTWPEVIQLGQELEACGVDVINTGIGWHEARIPTIATSVPRGAWSWVTKKLKAEGGLTVPLCATNRINMPETVEAVLANGEADLVSMARPFLADPEIMNKAARGDVASINTCIGCNQACLDHTFKMMTASCLVNPIAGYEKDLGPAVRKSVPPGAELRVAVVGAGPAGLAAACTAAERGHAVTLFDASPNIGGQFNLAKQVPGKEEFYETLRYFKDRLAKLAPATTNGSASSEAKSQQEGGAHFGKVALRLGHYVTEEDLTSSSSSSSADPFDKVILATGVVPRSLTIPGADHPKVVAYADVLSGKVTVGKTVAVVGAGGIGFDVSEFLTHTPLTGSSGAAHATSGSVSSGAPEGQSVAEFMNTWGVDMTSAKRGGITGPKDFEQPMASEREVFLLQRSKGKPGAGLGKTTGWIHKLTLKKSGVHMWGGVKEYLKVDDAGLHIRLSKPKKGDWPRPLQPELGETEASDGSTRDMVLPVDHVVVCAGQEPLKALQPCLQAAHIPHFLIGGAEAAAELDAKRAMDQGTRLAAALEDAESGAVFNQPVKWEAGVVKQVFKWMGR